MSTVLTFPALVSHQATAGTIGTQEGLIPSHAGVSGPEYPSNSTNTTAGRWLREFDPWLNQIIFTTPWAPFTNPLKVHRL